MTHLVETMTDQALRSIIATINPHGLYGFWRERAMNELSKRGVGFADCLTSADVGNIH